MWYLHKLKKQPVSVTMILFLFHHKPNTSFCLEQLGVLKERIERMREEAKIENAAIENLTKKIIRQNLGKKKRGC